jgi:xylulose-5-phosphate/fructose-6-phosphate phosphoketolase
VIDRVPGLNERYAHVRQLIRDLHTDHAGYIRETGDDMPTVKEWTWGYYSGATGGTCTTSIDMGADNV